MAKWTAIRYTSNHILDYIELDDTHSIFEVSVPKAWIGLTIGKLDIRRKFGINIIAYRKDGKLSVTVLPDMVLTYDMSLMVVGEYKALHKCFHI